MARRDSRGGVIARLCCILLMLITWRFLAATVCVNVAGLRLSQAVIGDGEASALAAAETWYDRALSIRPNDLRAQRALVHIAREREASVESLGLRREDILQRSDPLALFHLGMLDWATGDQERAIAVWQKVPISEYFFMGRGMLAYSSDSRSALDDYAISLAINPEPTLGKRTMYRDLCHFYLQRGDANLAVVWCQTCAQVEPIQRNWLYLAKALEANDEPERAIEAYLRAIETAPSSSTPHWRVAQVFESLGDPAKAYCHYARIEAMTDDASERQRALSAMATLALETPPDCSGVP